MRFQVPLPRPELRFRVPLTHTPSDTRAQVPLPQRTAKRLQICAVPLWAPTYTYGGARLSMLYAISGFPFVFHKLGNSQSSAVHVRPTFVRPTVTTQPNTQFRSILTPAPLPGLNACALVGLQGTPTSPSRCPQTPRRTTRFTQSLHQHRSLLALCVASLSAVQPMIALRKGRNVADHRGTAAYKA